MFCDFFLGEKWLEGVVERWNKRYFFRILINVVNFICMIVVVI